MNGSIEWDKDNVLPSGDSRSVYMPLIYRPSMPIPSLAVFSTGFSVKPLCKRRAASLGVFLSKLN
jgi:hypothetical protein